MPSEGNIKFIFSLHVLIDNIGTYALYKIRCCIQDIKVKITAENIDAIRCRVLCIISVIHATLIPA